jgi:hypothetical protein
MSKKTEAPKVYAAGLVQGIVLVTFPAASTIFTVLSPGPICAEQFDSLSWSRSSRQLRSDEQVTTTAR